MENRCVPFFAFLLLLAAPAGAAPGDGALDDIDRLLEVGADTLALHVIDQDQPRFDARPVAWQRWELRRLAILESRGDWSAVIARIAGYPSRLADDFSISARESAVRSHIALGNVDDAAGVIAGLIWGAAQDTAMVAERAERLSRWRAMLARSHLLAGRLADAQTTVLRYRLDYGGDPDGWRIAHAKALMRAGQNAQARELIAGLETTEVVYLKLLLEARDPGVDPVELLARMGPLLGGGRLLAVERAQLWASLATAAARYRDHEVRVTAMEQALALRGRQAAEDRLVEIDPDDLWDAYQAYAEALGNEAHLLVGRFDAWLEMAERFATAGDVKARALLAYLSIQGRDPRVAGLARARLVAALAGEPRGLRVLGALYLDSHHHAGVDTLAPELRAPLVAHALEASRPDLAVRLLAGLDAQARRALPVEWRAAVAVALIADGRSDEALPLFGEDVDAGGSSKAQMLDALVRIGLALQATGEYPRSAELLGRALAFAGSPWERRELLSLAAESETRAGRHERAARLYIESAAVPDGGPADAWSRAASLQAARALAQAGLDADAVGVLKSTLAEESPADARIFVEHALRRY